jgi:hypothetical protein
MAWDWINKIVRKVAEEVHKSKIDEFEKRMLKIEQKQAVILKSIQDNQSKLDKLDERLYQANMNSASAVGAINTIINTGIQNNKLLTQGDKINEQSNNK